MRPRTLPTRTLLLLAFAFPALAQEAPGVPKSVAAKPATPRKSPKKVALSLLNPNLILLDPGHGGPDEGAKLGEDLFEKDATVALADKLRTALAAEGFTVILTHNAASDSISPDARAEAANRTRAAACILLHASNGGHGVHLYTAALSPSPPPAATPSENDRPILSWDTAQAATLAQSVRLAGELSASLRAAHLPLVAGSSSVPPIDSMLCPAVALELAPTPAGSAADPAYQQKVAQAVVAALKSWRDHVTAENVAAQAAANPTATPEATGANPATPALPRPRPAPKPRPVPIPVETPDEVSPSAPKTPAPVIRRPPDEQTQPGAVPPQ